MHDDLGVETTSRPALSAAIRKTLVNTFITVSAMLGITAVAAWAMIGQPIGLVGVISLFVVSIVLLFVLRAVKKSAWGLVVLAAISAIMGALFGPALTHYLSVPNGAQTVATAFGLTAAVVAGCAGYTLTARRDFKHLHAMLFAGLIVLILAMLLNLFLAIPALSLTLSAVGALLFTGWLLYDLSEVIHGRETNYIQASIAVYLDIINLFSSLLNLLGLSRD